MTLWRAIPSWPEYEVSDGGTVRRRVSGRGTLVGRVLKPRLDQHGYPKVRLTRNYVSRNCFVHRLVAEAFIGPVPVGCEVNHLDMDRANARITNLEYVTRIGNMRHAFANGRRPTRGEQRTNAKLTWAQVGEIRELAGTATQRELARRYGVCHQTIGDVLRGEKWRDPEVKRELGVVL